LKQIYNYYKYKKIGTIINVTGCNNKSQLLKLSGMDVLTISPELLTELSNCYKPFPLKCSKKTAEMWFPGKDFPALNEDNFNDLLFRDKNARKALENNIYKCAKDVHKLENIIYNVL